MPDRKLSCLHHKLPLGVVAFIRSGRSLNSEVQPGQTIELTFGADHKYLVGYATVLHVAVTQSNDIPPRILAYNQDSRGRDLGGLRATLGIAHHEDAEVTVALVEVFEVPHRDESPRHVLPVGLDAPRDESVYNDGPTCNFAHQKEDDQHPDEDSIIGDMGDRLREEDKPGPHNVLTEQELDDLRDEHFSEEHEIDEAVAENDSRIADEVNAAASEAGRIYAEDDPEGAEKERLYPEDSMTNMSQAEIDGQSKGDLTLPIDPSSHRAARPDEDDELIASEPDEYDEDYDDDLDDFDDDEESELEDLLGDQWPEPRTD